ncbi:STAS domain-containing protein [Rhodococcus sp. NPDC059234]|uniref:STAS domain-containing protein n=1 Tax=Rhodococcus sp. NPDC059234 TaxID=3346781 RepID=UPI00366DF169
MIAATTLERRPAPHPDRPFFRPPDRDGCCHTAIVSVGGDLDATSIGQFRQVLDLALSTCYHRVVIDLSAADFVSIAAAAQLGEAKRQALRSRLDLTLVSGPPAVEHVLRVTGIRDLFRYHSSIRSAVAPSTGDAVGTD